MDDLKGRHCFWSLPYWRHRLAYREGQTFEEVFRRLWLKNIAEKEILVIVRKGLKDFENPAIFALSLYFINRSRLLYWSKCKIWGFEIWIGVTMTWMIYCLHWTHFMFNKKPVVCNLHLDIFYSKKKKIAQKR